MGLRLNPTSVSLRELPTEGRDFIYTRESGELNQSLGAIIGKNNYEVSFKIVPMGNSFDLRGHIQTQMSLECSLCAIEFKHPINLSLHELIVVQPALGKGDRQTHANHAHEWEAQGPDYIVLESETFNVAQYVYEMIALSEPTRPLGRPDCDESCENRKDRVERTWLSFGDDGREDGIKANPFKVLEKMKLKS